MSDKSWKAFERRIAKVFGGERRGADYGDGRGGKNDIIHPHWSVECKLLGRAGYADLLKAVRQAELASEDGQEPVAVVKLKNQHDADALVVYRLETFRAWRL
jgi:hypothetical protein